MPILNDVIFPILGYFLLAFCSIYLIVSVGNGIKKETENTKRFILEFHDDDGERRKK